MADLKSVKVMVEDTGFLKNALGEGWWEREMDWRRDFEQYRSSFRDKREWASKVEGWIMGPSGGCPRARAMAMLEGKMPGC